MQAARVGRVVIAIAWSAAGAIALVTLAVLAYGLVGQLRRFGRAVDALRADVEPHLPELTERARSIAQHRDSGTA